MSRPPRDGLETRIRFGCGFSFGVFFLGIALLYLVNSPELPLWYYLGTGGGALVLALLAVRFGDGFYHKAVQVISLLFGGL